ncbi:hypothetical protein ACIBG8_25770 [Nonomuraea sp. NPDC050556]|uniref:hypothetical protein n=1 Tax=Nonomuraea sp. NPDC050556 TaxID=3364369 RepID=UPI00378BB146
MGGPNVGQPGVGQPGGGGGPYEQAFGEHSGGGTPPEGPPSSGARRQPPRKRSTVLMGVGAVAALVLAVGAPTADRYLFYKSGRPTPTLQVVQPGQAGTLEHVSWKAAIENMAPPQGTKHNTPDKQWLKITVTRTANDQEGSLLTAKPELSLHDAKDRSWHVEVYEDNTPTDPHKVGQPYTLVALAVVPADVAPQVELHLQPDVLYKMNTPTKDLMKPLTEEEKAKTARQDTFVFRR